MDPVYLQSRIKTNNIYKLIQWYQTKESNPIPNNLMRVLVKIFKLTFKNSSVHIFNITLGWKNIKPH